MAVITSTATGNFSAGATWAGGVVPGAADDAVVATGHTVTIDTNTTVLSIQSSGGVFRISNGVTLTCTATNGVKGPSAGSNPTLGFNLAAGESATVVGNVVGSTAVSQFAITLGGTGTLNVTGNVTGGSVVNARGILVQSSGRVIVTGNVTSGSATNSWGIDLNTANGRADVIGTVTGGVAYGIVQNTAASTVVVTGSVTAVANAAIFNNQVGGVTDITGTVTASTNRAGYESVVICTFPPIIAGNIIDASNGVCGVYALNLAIRTTANGNYTDHRSSAGGAARVIRGDSTYWSTSVDGLSPANVRSGTAYGSGNALTGTLRVPDPQSVLFGVPTDATVGTASIVRDPWLSPL